MVIRPSEVYLVRLDPTEGHEIQRARPCLVVSPDEINKNLRTAIIAPLTSSGRDCVTRIQCQFQGKQGWVVLDQIRAVDQTRLVKRLGAIDKPTNQRVLETLVEMFTP